MGIANCHLNFDSKQNHQYYSGLKWIIVALCIPSYYLIQTSKAKILHFLEILRRNCPNWKLYVFLKKAGFTLWGKLCSLSKLHLFSNTSPLRIVCTFPFQCQNWKCNRQHHIDWSDISGKNCSEWKEFFRNMHSSNMHSIRI